MQKTSQLHPSLNSSFIDFESDAHNKISPQLEDYLKKAGMVFVDVACLPLAVPVGSCVEAVRFAHLAKKIVYDHSAADGSQLKKRVLAILAAMTAAIGGAVYGGIILPVAIVKELMSGRDSSTAYDWCFHPEECCESRDQNGHHNYLLQKNEISESKKKQEEDLQAIDRQIEKIKNQEFIGFYLKKIAKQEDKVRLEQYLLEMEALEKRQVKKLTFQNLVNFVEQFATESEKNSIKEYLQETKAMETLADEQADRAIEEYLQAHGKPKK